jgi:hypothetical protein
VRSTQWPTSFLPNAAGRGHFKSLSRGIEFVSAAAFFDHSSSSTAIVPGNRHFDGLRSRRACNFIKKFRPDTAGLRGVDRYCKYVAIDSHGLARTSNPMSWADSGSHKTAIDLICPGMANREAEVQRLALALALTAMTLCCGSASRAQTAFYPVELACQPLPSWYPRGWELMVRYPCYHVYGSSYYPPAYYPYQAVYPHQRVSIHAVHRVHRRPYLRPGWWW